MGSACNSLTEAALVVGLEQMALVTWSDELLAVPSRRPKWAVTFVCADGEGLHSCQSCRPEAVALDSRQSCLIGYRKCEKNALQIHNKWC